MTSTKRSRSSTRERLVGWLQRHRSKSRNTADDGQIQGSRDSGVTGTTPRDPQYSSVTTEGPTLTQTPSSDRRQSIASSGKPRGSTADAGPEVTDIIDNSVHPPEDTDQNSNTDVATLRGSVSPIEASSDLWSAAYREAVESLGNDIDMAILKGKSVALLFRELEEIDKEATEESAFLRGVGYLRTLQIPLERFKLALDLTSPLAYAEPATGAVFGVVSGVTAIAISFATADLEFAKQIGDMLEQISYIDDCDTLGQKTNKTDIHKALVQVYRKILEFYKAAFEILTKRGTKLVLKMVMETDRLPNIVQDFLKHANYLAKLVEKATLEIVHEIKSMLYDQEIARWLASDRMSQQSHYHASLQEVCANEACEFLLQDEKFTDWYRARESRQLAILGDMGYGKTVCMAFLVDTLRRRSVHQLPQPKLCYYYCRDDESGQASRILSALILALLEQLSGLKKTFVEWYKQAQASGCFEPATNAKKLEEFLHLVVGGLDRQLFIVIDGLDECDRASRTALLNILRGLMLRTPRLKILLSSRPHEEILEQLADTAPIDLVSNTERDRAIATKTVELRLSYLPEDVKALVIDRLSGMAQGNSIWTRMIVELIERRRIRAHGLMSRFLNGQTLPRGLLELYDTLLSRCTSDDLENLELAITALRILAVARRALTILELSWAATLGTADPQVTTVASLAELVDHQRLMSLIQPFISRVDFGDVTKRQIRLVHQSVKEWILDCWAPGVPRLEKSCSAFPPGEEMTGPRAENLESHMLNICIRYLLLDEIDKVDIFSEEQMALEILPQESDLFSDDENGSSGYTVNCSWDDWEEGMIRYDPTERGLGHLFVYASCHWMNHFGAITLDPLPDLGRIESLCRPGSKRLHNWIEQNRRPGCAIAPRFEFDSTLYDPLGITLMYGSDAMLRHMLDTSDFEGDAFLPQSAMEAVSQIIRWADLSRLRTVVLESKLKDQIDMIDFFRLLIGHWALYRQWRDDWDLAFELVDELVDTLVRDQCANELLCIAASRGCMPVIVRLMATSRHNAELRRELLHGTRVTEQRPFPALPVHQSIGEAVLADRVDVVEYLLQEGIEAHVRHINSRGENVLHLASKVCNPAMFRKLIPHLPDGVHQPDNQGDTPLLRVVKNRAATQDRYASAAILLTEGCALEPFHSVHERQALLSTAVELGDRNMCDILVRLGGIERLPDGSSSDRQSSNPRISSSEGEGRAEDPLELRRAQANAASVVGNSTAPIVRSEEQKLSVLNGVPGQTDRGTATEDAASVDEVKLMAATALPN